MDTYLNQEETGIPAIQVSETQKLTNLTHSNRENLYTARTMFPFVFFPDTIQIDRQKITIIHNAAFGVAQVSSAELKDIMNVQAQVGLLFGSIVITSKHFLNNLQTIKFIPRRDVLYIQRLLQGFIIAHQANIDTDHIKPSDLLRLLNKLGRGNDN